MQIAFLFKHCAVHQVSEVETLECHCMKLRIEFGLERFTMIHTGHGAGERQGGFDDLASGLGSALDDALPSHGHYLPRQQEAFAYTFRTERDSSAAARRVDAIEAFLLADAARAIEAA